MFVNRELRSVLSVYLFHPKPTIESERSSRVGQPPSVSISEGSSDRRGLGTRLRVWNPAGVAAGHRRFLTDAFAGGFATGAFAMLILGVDVCGCSPNTSPTSCFTRLRDIAVGSVLRRSDSVPSSARILGAPYEACSRIASRTAWASSGGMWCDTLTPSNEGNITSKIWFDCVNEGERVM